MPFKSEKQRRYLWANEPEIARDWTDTYGSGIAKALGGRIGYQDGTLAGIIDESPWAGQETTTMKGRTLDDAYGLYGYAPELRDFDTTEQTQYQVPFEGARTIVGVPTPSEENLMMGDINAAYGLTPQKVLRDPVDVLLPAYEDFLPTEGIPSLDLTQYAEPSEIRPQGWDYGDQWLTAEEDDDDETNWWGDILQRGALSTLARSITDNPITGAFIHPIVGGANLLRGGISNFANTMRGGLTQSGYETARDARIKQNRIDYMIARRDAGKPYSITNLAQLTNTNIQNPNEMRALTTPTPKPKPTTSYSSPARPHGNGGNQSTGSGGGWAGSGGRSDSSWDASPFREGGLAALWRR